MTVIDLATLSESQGFTIIGDAANDLAGYSVSAAGDVNGDGFDDFIVGAPGVYYGDETVPGWAYVIFGKASGFADIDLATLSAAKGFRISGVIYDQAGFSVSSAGDINGDGFDDIIVGAPATARATTTPIRVLPM